MVGVAGLIAGAWSLAEGQLLGAAGLAVFVAAILWSRRRDRAGKTDFASDTMAVFGGGFILVVITAGVVATVQSGAWGLAIFAGVPWLLYRFVHALRRASAQVYGPTPHDRGA